MSNLKKMAKTKALVENSSKPKEESKEPLKKDPKALNKLLLDINKKYGDNTLIKGSDIKNQTIQRIPSSIIALDLALGGGIPVGRYTQLEGAYSSTKTTVCLHIVREAQKLGYICAYCDVEGTITTDYMRQLGMDVDTLLYFRPGGLEECTNLVADLQSSGEVHLAVIDSLEALSPTKEQNKEVGESMQMGVKPTLLGEFFRKYQNVNNRLTREEKTEFTLLATNQLREKIGAYGNPEYSPGGRAKDFTSSVNIRLRRSDFLSQGKGENKEIVGQITSFKIEKNKTYKRMQTGEYDFYYAENDLQIPVGHVDNFKSIVMEGIAWGLIERGGAWFYLNKGQDNEQKFQGVDNLIAYLREHQEVVQVMKEQILDLDQKTM